MGQRFGSAFLCIHRVHGCFAAFCALLALAAWFPPSITGEITAGSKPGVITVQARATDGCVFEGLLELVSCGACPDCGHFGDGQIRLDDSDNAFEMRLSLGRDSFSSDALNHGDDNLTGETIDRIRDRLKEAVENNCANCKDVDNILDTFGRKEKLMECCNPGGDK